MRPFARVKMRGADEYGVLKKTVASRKLAAGKVRRAKKFVPIRCRLHPPMNDSYKSWISSRGLATFVREELCVK